MLKLIYIVCRGDVKDDMENAAVESETQDGDNTLSENNRTNLQDVDISDARRSGDGGHSSANNERRQR